MYLFVISFVSIFDWDLVISVKKKNSWRKTIKLKLKRAEIFRFVIKLTNTINDSLYLILYLSFS